MLKAGLRQNREIGSLIGPSDFQALFSAFRTMGLSLQIGAEEGAQYVKQMKVLAVEVGGPESACLAHRFFVQG